MRKYEEYGNKINIEPIKGIKFWEREYKSSSYNKIKYKSVFNIFNHSAQNNQINKQFWALYDLVDTSKEKKINQHN